MKNASLNLSQLTHQLAKLTTMAQYKKLFVCAGKNQIRKDFFLRYLKSQIEYALREDVQIVTLSERELIETALQLMSPSMFENIQIIHVVVSSKTLPKKKSKQNTKELEGLSTLGKVAVRRPVVLNVQEFHEVSELGFELDLESYKVLDCDKTLSRTDMLDLITNVGLHTNTDLDRFAKDKILSHVREDIFNLYELVEKWGLVQASNLSSGSTAEMFDRLTSRMPRNHVFDLFSLLRSNRINEASLLLDQLLAQGEEEVFLLGVIFKHIKDRTILSGKSASGLFVSLSETDLRLKSSRIDSKALLTDLVEILR